MRIIINTYRATDGSSALLLRDSPRTAYAQLQRAVLLPLTALQIIGQRRLPINSLCFCATLHLTHGNALDAHFISAAAPYCFTLFDTLFARSRADMKFSYAYCQKWLGMVAHISSTLTLAAHAHDYRRFCCAPSVLPREGDALRHNGGFFVTPPDLPPSPRIRTFCFAAAVSCARLFFRSPPYYIDDRVCGMKRGLMIFTEDATSFLGIATALYSHSSASSS